jgi:hypothetical protein
MNEIYASVLLLDNLIVNWKLSSNTKWGNTSKAFNNRQYFWVIQEGLKDESRLSVFNKIFSYSNNKEKEEIANIKAPKFYKQWEIHPKFKGFKPYTIEETNA